MNIIAYAFLTWISLKLLPGWILATVTGLQVGLLLSGAVLTENERELYPDGDRQQADAEIIARQGLPRRLLADDMVGTARFLASEGSAAVTGQVIEVGGGLVLR